MELFWIDRKGNPVPYAIIKPGGIKVQRTRVGAVWQISQTDGPKHSKPLGYFCQRTQFEGNNKIPLRSWTKAKHTK